jgi:hypothetical protein
MQVPDSAPRRAAFLLAGLLALAACGMGAVVWLLHPPLAGSQRPADFSTADGAAQLQTAPQPDLDAYRAQKRAELDTAGPEPGAPGFARIPLDRAMALMTERGLRADASASADASPKDREKGSAP